MLRKARITDIPAMHRLINSCAAREEMLARALGELYDNMRDYFVYEESGDVAGTCALHICWDDLAEIRSLCVVESQRRRGVGRVLVEACIEEAKQMGIKNAFVLTYRVDFFRSFGFKEADKKDLPQKIWTDCIKCPKFPLCDEVAMTTILHPHPSEGEGAGK